MKLTVLIALANITTPTQNHSTSTVPLPGRGGGSGGNTTDWSSPQKDGAAPGTPAKPHKPGLGVGGPKRSAKKKNKKKGSDSDSE